MWEEGARKTVCNLYNVTTNQEAIRQFTRAMIDSIGNLEPTLDIYPDRFGPIVRNTPAGREMAMVRWGLPSSQQALMQALIWLMLRGMSPCNCIIGEPISLVGVRTNT